MPSSRLFLWSTRGPDPQPGTAMDAGTGDAGVARAWPSLADDVARYCEAHAEHLELAERPRVVEGGEAAKHSPALIDSLQADMRRLAIDRQSFAVAIGGGAMLRRRLTADQTY